MQTDPDNCDYTLETGATRNFEAAKTLMDMEKKKQQALEDEEAANPMKVTQIFDEKVFLRGRCFHLRAGCHPMFVSLRGPDLHRLHYLTILGVQN